MSQYENSVYPSSGQKIDPNGVGQLATAEIIEKIFGGSIVCREHVITSPQGQAVVPVNNLDYKSNIPKFYPGLKDSPANAKIVYDSLVTLTKWLLKVGTYSYYEYKRCSGVGHDKENEWRSSGVALFSDSYTGNRSLNPTPSDGGVSNTKTMSVSILKSLATNCLNSWRSSSRPNCSRTYEFCHNSCHSNCHSNCHNNTHDNCHGFRCHLNGPGYNNAGHGGYKSNY